MVVQFHIHYYTQFGQQVCITGNADELGNFDESKAVEMKPVGDGFWELPMDINTLAESLEYRYIIVSEGHTARREYGNNHRICLKCKLKDCELFDYWQDEPALKFFYTSAFTNCLLDRNISLNHLSYGSGKLILRVQAPFVRSNQVVGISGDNALFGAWKPEKALHMEPEAFPYWSVSIETKSLPLTSNYKFVLMDSDNGKVSHYEWGEPRVLHFPNDMRQKMVVYSGMEFRFQEAPWKGAGVSIPIFSLRSEQSWGCGDFGDLKRLIDWASKTGMQLIQTLPLNDTRLRDNILDSYPYSAISCYALHPMYCCMSALPALNDPKRQEQFEEERKKLNAREKIAYEGVVQLKWEYLVALFEQNGFSTMKSDTFTDYFEENKRWLIPYAAFCYLRLQTGQFDFNAWGEWASYDEKAILELTDPTQTWYPQIAVHYYVQYLLHCQLKEAKSHAQAKRIVLKGDIPIGVSRYGVEAWSERRLFHMEMSVGAPPDDFSAKGQNWGFPSYNWEQLEKEGFVWWKQRFEHLSAYMDAYRIDHILGFFRIWEIPTHAVDGLLGSFHPILALTEKEITSKGFRFEAEKMTTPYLTSDFLHMKFGKSVKEIQNTFLNKRKDGLFELKADFKTQKQIKAYFEETSVGNGKEDWCEKVMSLCTEVLFVRDLRDNKLFHPRISVFLTEHFRLLPDDQKRILIDLYNNFYYARSIDFWKQEAKKKLGPIVEATKMLPCGEDLGMIPEGVSEVMQQLGILSLEIQRMPKKTGSHFENLNTLPYQSVLTTSTHDMSPLRLWWTEQPEMTQQFYNQILWKAGNAPTTCTEELATWIVRNHLFAPSMLVIFPWQDIMAMDESLSHRDPSTERINVPSNHQNEWNYRMHLTLEKLLKSNALNNKIHELISTSGRD